MRKLRRLVVIALGALIALGVVLLLGVNLYVQSQGAQAKIQQELSRRLGTSLRIRNMSLTPWGGLELSGITIAQSSSGGPGNFLEAKTFRLRVRLLSLFSKRLVIKEVALVKPTVVWPQNAEGKWRLPGSQEAESPPISTQSAATVGHLDTENAPITTNPVPVVPATSTNVSPPAEDALHNKPPRREPGFAVAPEVRRVSIKNGTFSFLDRKGALLASFKGLDFRTNIRSASALHGDAQVARISLRDRFFLEQLRSPLRYEPDVLELSKISARAANGEIKGYFAMQPEAEDSPFTTSVKFHDVLADQIVENAGGPKGIVNGKLEGSFQASGKTADPGALVGSGEIFLRDGRVQQYSLLVLLGQISLQREDQAQARALFEESRSSFKQVGDQAGEAEALIGFASVAAMQGDFGAAHHLYQESFLILQRIQYQELIPSCLEALAAVTAEQGEPVQAAHLWGSSEALREAIGTPIPPVYRSGYQQAVTAARSQLGEEDFATSWAQGRSMSPEQAMVVRTTQQPANRE